MSEKAKKVEPFTDRTSMPAETSLVLHRQRVRELEEREQAYQQLVLHLHRNNGSPPPRGATGLWVDLFNELTD